MRITQNISTAKKVALGGFVNALAIVCLYLANVMPTGRLSLLAISSTFVLSIVIELGTGAALLTYFSTSILALIILPNKMMVIPYVLFFGYYGIAKYYIERLNKIVIEWVLKILLFNGAMFVIYSISVNILFENITTRFPMWIMFILWEIIFIMYDYSYSIIIGYYNQRIRKLIR